MILSDVDIRKAMESGELVIDPLQSDTVRENGVDLRLGDEILRLRNKDIYDIHSNKADEFVREKGEAFVLNPNEHILILIRERIKLSSNLVGFINLRSTYARLGILIPPTIVDAGFEGNLTIGMLGSNFPIKLYPGERMVHLILARTESP
ncbi:MAG: dCTP deaminase, partial [Nanoarchaeota archaeon]|nr:dCTP deaminase [Nanoarchaeota archaeon]